MAVPFAFNARRREASKYIGLSLFNKVTYLAKMLVVAYRRLGRKVPTKIASGWDRIAKAM